MAKSAVTAVSYTLPRYPIGMAGLDEMTGGGLPSGRQTLVCGAEGELLIAAPTWVKKLPLPMRGFIDDMSESQRILLGLNLRQSKRPDPSFAQ